MDLGKHFCSCKEWRRTGLPCGHASAVILGRKEDPQQYADDYFTLERYKATYNHPIFPPILDADRPEFNWREYIDEALQSDEEEQDLENELLPPNTCCPAGRPKKKRIHRAGENEISIRPFKRSRCKEEGHSRRTCREAI